MIRLSSKFPKLKSYFKCHNQFYRAYCLNSKTNDEEEYIIEEIQDNSYEINLQDEFSKLYTRGYQQQDLIDGFATKEGTQKYSSRSKDILENNFKSPYYSSLKLSSVGIGTYLGDNSLIDDLKMFNAIIETVQSNGVNVIDTAINYRSQKSERVIGAALRYLFKQRYERNELFICSKNGYLTDDADKNISSLALIESLIAENKIKAGDIIANYHCIHPEFLQAQLEQTLSNIGIQTLDLYYLHNVAESQLLLTGHEEFSDRLLRAFEFCEEKVYQGKIRSYGMATWSCFRSKPNQDQSYVGMQEIIELVHQAAGKKHHFHYIQLPYNFMMSEAFTEEWQILKENDSYSHCTTFEAAEKLKINIMTSVPLSQGLMIQYPISTKIFQSKNSGVEHLQYVRSTPAPSLITALVGQKSRHHVVGNLDVVKVPRLTQEEWYENRKLIQEMFE